MSERISAIVTAESAADGTLSLVLRAVDGAQGFQLSPVTLTLVLWLADSEIVRMKIEHPVSGIIAYLQAAAPALEFARAIGLEAIR